MSVRSFAGHSLKSSVKHSLEIDERDSPFLPSSGFHVKMTQELAGLGGDVFFGRSEFQGTGYLPLSSSGWVSGEMQTHTHMYDTVCLSLSLSCFFPSLSHIHTLSLSCTCTHKLLMCHGASTIRECGMLC